MLRARPLAPLAAGFVAGIAIALLPGAGTPLAAAGGLAAISIIRWLHLACSVVAPRRPVPPNETSIVLRAAGVVFPGDIQKCSVEELLTLPDVHARWLLLPHHGSTSGSTRTSCAQGETMKCYHFCVADLVAVV